MRNKAVLIAAMLALAIPAFADNPSNSKTPVTVQNSKPPPQADTLQFATAPSYNGPGTATTSEAGKTPLSGLNLQNPCKKPNPPRSCKQAKPSH
jgi:hypothetical protein